MDLFLLLMIIYFVYLSLAWIISKGRINSPSVIFSASFSAMVCLGYIYKDYMGYDIEESTFSVLAIAGGLFLLTETVVSLLYNNSNRRVIFNKLNSNSNITKHPIIVSTVILRMCICFMVFSLLTAIFAVYTNTSGETFTRMTQYKEMLIYDADSVRYQFIVSMMYKINTALAYVLGYVLIYNKVAFNMSFFKQKKILVLLVLFVLFSSIAQGARQPAFEMVVFLFLIYTFLLTKDKKRKEVIKFIFKSIPLALVLIVVFYFMSELIGRRQTERGIFEYLAVYFCGGLYAFNLYIENPCRTEFWGQSSFADIYTYLIKMGIVPSSASMAYKEFDLYGNTVTIFGRWYEDFGEIGVYVMTILVSLVFSWVFYHTISFRNNKKENHLARILYGKILIALVWAGYDDRVRALLSVTTMLILVLIALTYWILVKKKLRIRIS